MEPTSSNQGPKLVRAKLIISGRVQGVYFRASARDVAHAPAIIGLGAEPPWMAMLRAWSKGKRALYSAFIAWCHDGPSGAHVDAVRVAIEPYTGEFHDFRITG